jgi:hypothetical protein
MLVDGKFIGRKVKDRLNGIIGEVTAVLKDGSYEITFPGNRRDYWTLPDKDYQLL